MWRGKNRLPAMVGVLALSALSVGCGSTSKHAGAGLSTPAVSHSAVASPVAPPSSLPSEVLASIQLDSGSAPAPMTMGYGSIWVGSHRTDTLYRIDPATDHVVAKIDLGQNACTNVRAFDERIFIGYCDDSTKEIVVSATTNQVVASIATAAVYGDLDGAVWAASDDGSKLERLDPSTYQVLATIDAPGEEGVVGGGYVWVADSDPDSGIYNGTIFKVDPQTSQIVATLHTPETYLDVYMDYDEASGSIWLKGDNDHWLTALNTTTGVSRKIPLAPYSALTDFSDDPPTSGLGSIWVRTADDTVSRIDPQSGAITARFPATGKGGWPVVGFGSLWVANFDDDSVWRVQVPS